MADSPFQRELFLLTGYLLASARGLYDEPAGYGPFRLLDAARRLVALMAGHDLGDPYLAALQAELERACTGTASDAELRGLADRLVLAYAEELDRRLGPGDPGPAGSEAD